MTCAAPLVLVIDDDDLIHRLVGAVLKKGGFEKLSAYDGQEGLALARTRKPQLIILDIMMPGLNGFEVLQYLKTSPLTSSIPVIFLTGQIHQAERSQAKNLGAVDFMEKPFEPQELLARINTYVKTERRQHNLAQLNDRLTLVTQAALELLNPNNEADLEDLPGSPLSRLLSQIDLARERAVFLGGQWPILAGRLQPDPEGDFSRTLAELKDNLAEIQTLARRLAACRGWMMVS